MPDLAHPASKTVIWIDLVTYYPASGTTYYPVHPSREWTNKESLLKARCWYDRGWSQEDELSPKSTVSAEYERKGRFHIERNGRSLYQWLCLSVSSAASGPVGERRSQAGGQVADTRNPLGWAEGAASLQEGDRSAAGISEIAVGPQGLSL